MNAPVQAIRQSARQMVRELHLLDSKHCIEGFTFSECHLMTELDALDSATASELAELLVLEKSTVSRLVNGLENRGMLESTPDPGDRRRRHLRLTEIGHEGVERIHEFANLQVNEALEFVPEPALQGLVEGLDAYARALRQSRLSMPFEIRAITKHDNRAVARIIRQVMTEFDAVGSDYSISDPEVDAMYEAYPAPTSSFYVVSRKSRVLGCGGMGPLKGGDADVCELRKMYFLPELRGTGMGSRLLKQILVDAKEAGFRQCYLESLDRMTAARKLYAKHGFKTICAPMGNTGHGGCNAWMVKDL